jgi:hypothetical protein
LDEELASDRLGSLAHPGDTPTAGRCSPGFGVKALPLVENAQDHLVWRINQVNLGPGYTSMAHNI